MKKIVGLLIAFVLIMGTVFSLTGCNDKNDDENINGEAFFDAVILNVFDKSVFVEVKDGRNSALKAGQQATVLTESIVSDQCTELEKDKEIRVVFNGDIMESEPVQISKVFAIYALEDIDEITDSEISGLESKSAEGEDISTEDAENMKKSFVGEVVEETSEYMVVRPNSDEKESEISDKIRVNYKNSHGDYLYGIGRKVVIYYTDEISKENPIIENAEDDDISIGYRDFEISVEKSDKEEAVKILNNTELNENNSDYDLYYYGIKEVNVNINGDTMSLEKALRDGKITLESIAEKGNRDAEVKLCETDVFSDGGSQIYKYPDYTIVKLCKLDGNRDIYISSGEFRDIVNK